MATCYDMYAAWPTSLAPDITYFVGDGVGGLGSGAGAGGPTAVAPKAAMLEGQARQLRASANDPAALRERLLLQQQTGIKLEPGGQARGYMYVEPGTSHNQLRPETVESLFILWRVTHNATYREWAWRIFQVRPLRDRYATVNLPVHVQRGCNSLGRAARGAWRRMACAVVNVKGGERSKLLSMPHVP